MVVWGWGSGFVRPVLAQAFAPSAEGCWPGVARRLLTFLLLRQKKSKQKKRRPWLLRPFASLRATCGARSRRGLAKLATLRFAQTTRSLIRLALRSSAHPQGVGTGIPNSRRQKPEYINPQGLAKASPCLSWFVLWYLSSVPAPDCPVLAGPRSADVGGSGIALV